jgi:hypothetical protein
MTTTMRWRKQVVIAAAGTLLALARFSPVPADIMSLGLDPVHGRQVMFADGTQRFDGKPATFIAFGQRP